MSPPWASRGSSISSFVCCALDKLIGVILAQNMAPMCVYLRTDLEWVTPERSIAHLNVCTRQYALKLF